MPKRKSKDSEYILRKIKKLEKKLLKRNRSPRSSSRSNTASPAPLEDDNHEQNEPIDVDIEICQSDEPIIDQTILNPISQPPTDTQLPHSVEAIDLDESIMEMLGETPSKKKKHSPPIQNELSIRWEHIVVSGLSKEVKKSLLEKYFLPENCVKIGSPTLNPEIKAALSETLIKKDKAIENKQNQNAIVLTCLSHALTKMFASENKDTETIKLLIDAGRLLCDSQYIESMSRRSFVTSTIKKEIKDQLYSTEIDTFLFGEKLAETLKAAKAINKSGAEMKNIQTKPPPNQTKFNQQRPLNARPPAPTVRQTGAGRRTAPAFQQPRRYQAPLLPPARLSHQAPLPPPAPPQRSRGRTQTRH